MKAGRFGAQAAMEFLVTYGWAIIIIAIVFAALVELGLFGQFTYVPRASSGSCYVYRPFGAYNIKLIALEGVCQGELPKYVGQFDGVAGYVSVNEIYYEAGTNSMTFTLWFKVLSYPGSWPMMLADTGGSPRNGYDLFVGGAGSGIPGQLDVERFGGGAQISTYSTKALSTNNWYFAAVTYNGYQLNLYLNGTLVGTPALGSAPIVLTGVMEFGSLSGSNFGNYQVADVQEYSAALTQNEIQVLNVEGIGGAPVRLQNLIGWWPLNGDAVDYSGNGNNGNSISVTYIDQWLKGYSVP